MCNILTKGGIGVNNSEEFVKKYNLTNGDTIQDLICNMIYNSCAIEGNKMTLPDTTELLYGGINYDIVASRRDINDIINNKEALEYLLNCEVIRNTEIIKCNEIINKNILNTKGFKTVDNKIKGASSLTTRYDKVPEEIYKICKEFEESKEDIVKKIAKFHMDFEHIHPFADGNGRTGRLIMIAQAIKANVKIHIITKDERNKYINILDKFDYEGLEKLLKEI